MSAKILIVDDQAVMLRLIGLPLEQEGFTIITAMTGAEALQKIQAEKPDLVVLDILLPDANGIDLCRRIRQVMNLVDLPIIILSGQTELSAKIQGLEAGADEYVTKPVDPKEMVVRVRALLARTQRLRQLPSAAATRQGAIISVIGCKGGVGTTTLVANLATALAMQRHKTIALELRPYFGTLARHFNLRPGPTLSEIAELVPQHITAQQVTPRLLGPTLHGLQVLVGPQQLREYREIQPDQVEALLNVLVQLASYVLVDLPHMPSVAGRAALRAAQTILVVVEPERTAVAAAQALLELLRAWSIAGVIRVVVVNRLQSSLGQSLSEIERALNSEVVGTVPGAPDLAASALVTGAPLVASAPGTVVAEALMDIAGHIVNARRVAR
ncbi:MAG TPA: response regulator [Caldilineaceae bacterium]|nr:response regulator [Caldilineaceae bacterium]